FSMCADFPPNTDLRSWIAAHEARPATFYCNWVGRTVRQTREEEQLRRALADHLNQSPKIADQPAPMIHQALRQYVHDQGLKLTPPDPTPFSYTIGRVFDWLLFILLLVLGVVTLPITIIPLLLIAWRLRIHEKSDRPYTPPPDPQWNARLAEIEDHDVTNQFSVMGAVKPGLLRTTLTAVVLWVINLTARILYNKGRLARVHTIHFARWVYMDNGSRLFFASNYDGSL